MCSYEHYLAMTKTITQLRPLIYGVLLATPAQQKAPFEHLRSFLHGAAFLLYVAAGLRISSDTGLAPWDWGFWLILVPLFALGEWTLRELSRWAAFLA